VILFTPSGLPAISPSKGEIGWHRPVRQSYPLQVLHCCRSRWSPSTF